MRWSLPLAIVALWLSAVAPAARAGDACNAHRGLVILVEFSDIRPPIDRDFVAERFRQLDRYVREMSYGRACTEIHLSGWHRLPDPVARYAISPANLKVDRSRVFKLVQDAIDAADGENDFSRFDYVVVFLGATFRQYGMVGLAGYPGMLGWQREIAFRTRRGQSVLGGVAIFTANAHVGTLFHDIAHIWGGVKDGKRAVPCLYDHDIQARHPTRDSGWEEALINMGFWDPMSCHFNKRDLPPPGISSWTKLRLGWLPPEKVRVIEPGQSAEVLLGPLEDGAAETLAIRIPLSATRYLLVENRQPIGLFDPHLPGHGVLIMRADDDIAESRFGRAPVRLADANPSRRHLDGAAYDLPDNSVFIDRENNIEIRLIEKIGASYRIRIGRTGAP